MAIKIRKMTVKNMFSDNGPLSGLKEKNRKKFLDMGKVGFLGVDTSIYLHQWCSHDSTAMPNTAIPRYQSKDIEYKIMALHNELCKKADTVVYFFEGVDLPLKSQTKLERKGNVDSQKAKLDGLVRAGRKGPVSALREPGVPEARRGGRAACKGLPLWRRQPAAQPGL